jgi:MFS family permease
MDQLNLLRHRSGHNDSSSTSSPAVSPMAATPNVTVTVEPFQIDTQNNTYESNFSDTSDPIDSQSLTDTSILIESESVLHITSRSVCADDDLQLDELKTNPNLQSDSNASISDNDDNLPLLQAVLNDRSRSTETNSTHKTMVSSRSSSKSSNDDITPQTPVTWGSAMYLLRHNHAFLCVFLAQSVSRFGDFLTMTAALDIIANVTDSSWAISGFMIAQTLPYLLSISISGVVADTYDRLQIMIACDFVRMLIVPCFIIATWDTSYYWVVYLAGFVLYTGAAFFDPCLSAVLPAIVGEENVLVSSTINGVSFGILLGFGGATGGYLMKYTGASACFVVDSLTYVISASLVLLSTRLLDPHVLAKIRRGASNSGDYSRVSTIHSHDQANAANTGDQNNDDMGDHIEMHNISGPTSVQESDAIPSLGHDLIPSLDILATEHDNPKACTDSLTSTTATRTVAMDESHLTFVQKFLAGLYYMWSNKDLMFLTLYKCAGNVAMGGLDTANVRLVKLFYNFGSSDPSTAIGILYSCSGIGSMLSAALRWALDKENTPLSGRYLLSYAYVLIAFSGMGIVVAPNTLVFLLSNLLWWVGESTVYIVSQTAMQTAVPDQFRGRVFAAVISLRLLSHLTGSILFPIIVDQLHVGLLFATAMFVGIQVIDAVTWTNLYVPFFERTTVTAAE